ncbi:23S rRNA (pseudouridine(1915)-N(3))-methyltransferase RlmH [Amaricoccus tamworthensis]|uniref:23S rRNA (pseudouridine(1915)-N(3))-methyltransferase RlmH n=1 Tax=Amaricoccus tamworthensis TaxID=57002 RepID=UPI003C7EB68C
MRLTLVVVGRLRSGPEADLVDDYLTRFDRTGKPSGLGPSKVVEVENKRGGGSGAEADLILNAIPKGATVVALDERGRTLTSPDFAQKLQSWADTGTRDLALIIGGADGLTNVVRDRADFLLSFGKMVWPHMLVRVMLSEQLYRAASILSGGPYHRN